MIDAVPSVEMYVEPGRVVILRHDVARPDPAQPQRPAQPHRLGAQLGTCRTADQPAERIGAAPAYGRRLSRRGLGTCWARIRLSHFGRFVGGRSSGRTCVASRRLDRGRFSGLGRSGRATGLAACRDVAALGMRRRPCFFCALGTL